MLQACPRRRNDRSTFASSGRPHYTYARELCEDSFMSRGMAFARALAFAHKLLTGEMGIIEGSEAGARMGHDGNGRRGPCRDRRDCGRNRPAAKLPQGCPA